MKIAIPFDDGTGRDISIQNVTEGMQFVHKSTANANAWQTLDGLLQALRELDDTVPTVVLRADRGAAVAFEEDEEQVIIGQGPECDLQLSDEYASTQHARVYRSKGRLLVDDLGSTNGTYCNGVRVYSRAPVKVGDAIRVGRTRIDVCAPSETT